MDHLLTKTSLPFNPAYLGTPESRWQAALKNSPLLRLFAREMLVVSPHPDDEVLGAGGLIHAAAHMQCMVTLLSVTDGEAAYPDWRDLRKVRRRELKDALWLLAPQITTEHLNIPDGQVSKSREALFNAISRRLTPSTVLVAPYERDGHPDHDATGAVCCEIARLRGVTVWRYPIWTWHHGTPEQFAGTVPHRFLLDATTQHVKARAVSCFASQIRPICRIPIVPAHVLPYFSRPYEVFLT